MSLKRSGQSRAVEPQRLIPGLCCALLLAASCTQDPLRGHVILSGSSTLAPMVTGAVERWNRLHPSVETRVEAIGSDAGLERLVRYDEADLALISRPLTDDDHEEARKTGKTLVALPLAWDAVCLVVPTSNTWAASLTLLQAAQAFTDAPLWSDLDPAWPTQPLRRFVLGPNSGTTEVFAAKVLGGSKARLYEAPMVQSSEDDRILARGISQVEGAVGFLGWTTVRESPVPLRLVSLDGVAPTEASIRDGTYGLPRQLWLVGDASRWRDRAEVVSLIRYFYDTYNEVTAQTSLIPLSAQERSDAVRAFEDHL